MGAIPPGASSVTATQVAGFEANAGPLVGRSRETMFLVERLLNAHTACEFVVLRGPGGIGKTALLDLIGQRASSAGFSVLEQNTPRGGQAFACPPCVSSPQGFPRQALATV